MEEDRNTWRHFILGMYSNMELDQPFRERLAAGILDLLRLKPVVEDRPLDGVLSAWVTSQDYVKTLHILCFIVTANAVVVAGAQQYRMKGDVSVHTPNVISRKEISTAAFTPGKGGLLGHGALIELSVGSKAQQFSFSQDRKTRDEVNSKVRRTCSLLGG